MRCSGGSLASNPNRKAMKRCTNFEAHAIIQCRMRPAATASVTARGSNVSLGAPDEPCMFMVTAACMSCHPCMPIGRLWRPCKSLARPDVISESSLLGLLVGALRQHRSVRTLYRGRIPSRPSALMDPRYIRRPHALTAASSGWIVRFRRSPLLHGQVSALPTVLFMIPPLSRSNVDEVPGHVACARHRFDRPDTRSSSANDATAERLSRTSLWMMGILPRGKAPSKYLSSHRPIRRASEATMSGSGCKFKADTRATRENSSVDFFKLPRSAVGASGA
ncbi:hypothetical protein L1887_50156 [Cichorium endivia]|nr:hypothetical protein L1887_50156 [Cichorium endivia]